MFFEKKAIEVFAPAKVNLFLEVVRRRDDGYHDIRSVVMPVSLCDELMFAAADSISLTVAGDSAAADSLREKPQHENLVLRAARMYREYCRTDKGASITLLKRIPLGGGLAGGSSDAAATLRGLRALWGRNESDAELVGLGEKLGCDVPVMLFGKAAVMEGTGERIKPLHAGGSLCGDGWWITLFNPGFEICTGDIYRRCEPGNLTKSPQKYSHIVSALAGDSVTDAALGLFNGLEAGVFRKYPLLRILVEALVAEGALGALLSGSGASVFALARSERDARAIERRVRARLDFDIWSDVVKLLPDGVMVAHGPLEARV